MPVNIPGIAIEGASKDQYRVTLDVTQSIWDGGTAGAEAYHKDWQRRRETTTRCRGLQAGTDRVNQLYFGILLVDEQLEPSATGRPEQLPAHFGICRQRDGQPGRSGRRA